MPIQFLREAGPWKLVKLPLLRPRQLCGAEISTTCHCTAQCQPPLAAALIALVSDALFDRTAAPTSQPLFVATHPTNCWGHLVIEVDTPTRGANFLRRAGSSTMLFGLYFSAWSLSLSCSWCCSTPCWTKALVRPDDDLLNMKVRSVTTGAGRLPCPDQFTTGRDWASGGGDQPAVCKYRRQHGARSWGRR